MLEFIIFVLIVLVLVVGGFWLQAGTKTEIEQRRLAKDWPKTTGTVTNVNVEKLKGFRYRAPGRIFYSRIETFKPVIHYSYRAAGQSYQSSKYKNSYLTQGGEWVTILPKTAEKIAAEYPEGKAVTVTYNPENPAQAYLAINSSIALPLTFRILGFLLFAAAALVVIQYARVITRDMLAQRAARENPALLSAASVDIKAGLERDLGLTCQLDEKGFGKYKTWDCKGSSLLVSFYCREAAPEKVDRLYASTDSQEAPDFFVSLVKIALPQVDPMQFQDWVAKTAPVLSEDENKAETTIGGVQFIMSLAWGNRLTLVIGETQSFR